SAGLISITRGNKLSGRPPLVNDSISARIAGTPGASGRQLQLSTCKTFGRESSLKRSQHTFASGTMGSAGGPHKASVGGNPRHAAGEVKQAHSAAFTLTGSSLPSICSKN